MKKIYMTPIMRVASSSFRSGMIATSGYTDGDAYVDLGDPSNSPTDPDNRGNEPITPIEGGEALGKYRFYTGY